MAVTVALQGDVVGVELTGADRLLAFKSRLDVPTSRITAARAMHYGEVSYTQGTWLRAPGGYLPGVFHHGSYGRRPKREFWAVFGRPPVLVIDVAEWDYHRIVLSVPDPERVVAELAA